MMKISTINLVQRKIELLYQNEKILIFNILEQLIQLNGTFVVGVEIHQHQYLLILFVFNYLILLYYFKKVIHVKLLMEEKLKLVPFSKYLFWFITPICSFVTLSISIKVGMMKIRIQIIKTQWVGHYQMAFWILIPHFIIVLMDQVFVFFIHLIY